jgi:hypothetical protein
MPESKILRMTIYEWLSKLFAKRLLMYKKVYRDILERELQDLRFQIGGLRSLNSYERSRSPQTRITAPTVGTPASGNRRPPTRAGAHR